MVSRLPGACTKPATDPVAWIHSAPKRPRLPDCPSDGSRHGRR